MSIAVERPAAEAGARPARVIMRFFGPGNVNRARDIINRVLTYPEPEVERLLAGLGGRLRAQASGCVEVFAEHYEQIRGTVPDGRGAEPVASAACSAPASRWSTPSSRSRSSIRRSSPPCAGRRARGLDSVPDEPAGHRRGPHLVDRLPHRASSTREGMSSSNRREPTAGRSRPPCRTCSTSRVFQRDLATLGVPPNRSGGSSTGSGRRFTRDQLAEAIDEARGDERGLRVPRRDRRHADLGDPGELSASPSPSAAQPRVGDRDLSVLGHRTARHRRPAAGAVHRRRRHATSTTEPSRRSTAAGSSPSCSSIAGGDTIDISLITGECAKNKGMALFPRRIDGRYAMISRIDNENLYYMESDDVGVWDQAQLIQAPKFPWQVMQIGNCGSPIETEEGWLLLTHGVGPMRQYCIGATLARSRRALAA